MESLIGLCGRHSLPPRHHAHAPRQ
jgi:hypothetical protein